MAVMSNGIVTKKSTNIYKHWNFPGVWQTRNEGDNFPQKHDSELIKEEKRKEVEEEIRGQVDELMRTELKNLKAVS